MMINIPPTHTRYLTLVLPDMLFRGLFIVSSLKFYFGNPGWYVVWLGMVDRQCLA
jgi:hypothetical protein